jgi:thiaminase/transcriptional activator TenA
MSKDAERSPHDDLWDAIDPVYQQILEHPFISELSDGTLPEEAFRRYLVQDSLFLDDYARALALAAARAPDTDTLRMFASHASEAIDAEREMQERLLAELGVSGGEVVATPRSPTTLGYGAYLIKSAILLDRHAALAAILPCYWIYWEVGLRLAERGSPDPRYQQWMETYTDPGFEQAVSGCIAAANAALDEGSLGEIEEAQRHALIAARFEWMFWDAAYRAEAWPV